jgi:hypothetical protein
MSQGSNLGYFPCFHLGETGLLERLEWEKSLSSGSEAVMKIGHMDSRTLLWKHR